MTMARILCLSYDNAVSEARRIALKTAGYEVIATTVLEQARRALQRQRIDVLVVGHHFTDAESDVLIAEARMLWAATAVVVTGMGAGADPRADVSVPVLDGPAGLVKAVEAALRRMVAV